MTNANSVVEIPNLIFAVGWDKLVTEFTDDGKEELAFINWQLCHSGEIICAAKNPSEAIATCSCSCELVVWDSWTGQPYLRFNIKHPKTKLNIVYKKSEIILVDQEYSDSSSDSGNLNIFLLI